MKKINLKGNLALAASALAFSSVFVGCTDFSEFSEADFQKDAKMKEYYNNFVKEFGEPDPNHTWGWGMTPEMADAILKNSPATRASGDDYNQPGKINVNRNEWCNANNPYSLLNVYGVPGWPNDDGRYYAKEGVYTDGHYRIYEKGAQPSSVNMPNGDVTEYEILWVSDKVHQLGANIKQYEIPLHVSDYYIQAVSCDGDYETDADYLAGTYKKYGNNYDNYQMDHLLAYSLVGNAETHINNNNAGINEKPQTHIGNNSGRNIIYVQSAGTEDFKYHPSNATDGRYYDKLVLVEFSWTEPLNPDWSKVGTGTDKITLEYALAHPEALDPAGKTVDRTGYYICFDFQCEKSGESWPKYEGDNVYDNWILKLTPGMPIPKNRWPKRLMCEDLGNTYDFDFNDAVFDLSFASNVADPSGQTYDMLVVVQAAGGTLPIQIAIDPAGGEAGNMEIHNLLGGNPTSTPVNVIQGGKKAPAALYRIKNVFTFDPSSLGTTDYGDKDTHGNPILVPNYNTAENLLAQMAAAAFTMKIYIQNGGWTSVSGYALYQGLRDNYNGGTKGTSAVPQLFNCSSEAKWTYEEQPIKDAYKFFGEWVANEQGNYRLRWDETQYFYRAAEGQQPVMKGHTPEEITSWLGSWDFGPRGTTEWGKDCPTWIDKSKFWGGNGPE